MPLAIAFHTYIYPTFLELWDFTLVPSVSHLTVMVIHCHPLQLVHEVQLWCVELLETIFSLDTYLDKGSCRSEAVIEISRCLVAVQRELGLSYIPEISSVVLSLFLTLVQAEFEHKQLSIIRMLLLLFKWKDEKGMIGIIQ